MFTGWYNCTNVANLTLVFSRLFGCMWESINFSASRVYIVHHDKWWLPSMWMSFVFKFYQFWGLSSWDTPNCWLQDEISGFLRTVPIYLFNDKIRRINLLSPLEKVELKCYRRKRREHHTKPRGTWDSAWSRREFR